MQGKKRIRIGLISTAVALVTMAFAASVASATVVTPANTQITATLKAGTNARFLPANAFSETGVSCKSATIKFTTPTSEAGSLNNKNKLETGKYSAGPGSVTMSVLGEPGFLECGLVMLPPNPETEFGSLVSGATITTSTGWPIVAEGVNATEGIFALGIPSGGVNVSSSCNYTMGNGVIGARYINATKELKLDGQLEGASAFCGNFSPFQFEATFVANKELSVVP